MTISLDPASESRRILEDIRHFLVTINGGTITTDGEPFVLDAGQYIADLDRLLPHEAYTRPSDDELRERVD